jgi:sugar lactone lactonase YvrE
MRRACELCAAAPARARRASSSLRKKPEAASSASRVSLAQSVLDGSRMSPRSNSICLLLGSAAALACTSFESEVRAPNHDIEVVAGGIPLADGLAVDPSGALLASEEYRGGGVRRVDPVSGYSSHIVRDLADPDNLLVLHGEIYVTEEDDQGRIIKIDSQRNVTAFASGLTGPEGLDVGPDGWIYVAEHANPGHVYRFALDGRRETLGQVTNGEGLRVLEDGSVVVAETSLGRVSRLMPDGSRLIVAEGLDAPDGIAYDAGAGRLLVTEDAAPGRLLEIDLDSGEIGVVATGLHSPQTMLLEDDGAILVAEQGEDRILRLRPIEVLP